MKQIKSFATPRVKARHMTPGDLEDLASMYQNPEVMTTLGGIRDRAQVLSSMERNLKHQDEHGYAYWIFEDEAHHFMGRGGLMNTHIEGVDEVEIGYALLPEYWGKGIATEVGKEIVRIGFEDLGLNEIVCFALPENKASIRVMEKLGFAFEKECVYKKLKHVLYRLTKEQWIGEE